MRFLMALFSTFVIALYGRSVVLATPTRKISIFLEPGCISRSPGADCPSGYAINEPGACCKAGIDKSLIIAIPRVNTLAEEECVIVAPGINCPALFAPHGEHGTCCRDVVRAEGVAVRPRVVILEDECVLPSSSSPFLCPAGWVPVDTSTGRNTACCRKYHGLKLGSTTATSGDMYMVASPAAKSSSRETCVHAHVCGPGCWEGWYRRGIWSELCCVGEESEIILEAFLRE